ncbi:unnamed protein product [Sympodiomycopsis kandeliae]
MSIMKVACFTLASHPPINKAPQQMLHTTAMPLHCTAIISSEISHKPLLPHLRLLMSVMSRQQQNVLSHQTSEREAHSAFRNFWFGELSRFISASSFTTAHHSPENDFAVEIKVLAERQGSVWVDQKEQKEITKMNHVIIKMDNIQGVRGRRFDWEESREEERLSELRKLKCERDLCGIPISMIVVSIILLVDFHSGKSSTSLHSAIEDLQCHCTVPLHTFDLANAVHTEDQLKAKLRQASIPSPRVPVRYSSHLFLINSISEETERHPPPYHRQSPRRRSQPRMTTTIYIEMGLAEEELERLEKAREGVHIEAGKMCGGSVRCWRNHNLCRSSHSRRVLPLHDQQPSPSPSRSLLSVMPRHQRSQLD